MLCLLLLTLLLFQKREQAAQTLIERRGLTVQQVDQARQRAQGLLARKAQLEAEENRRRGKGETKQVSDSAAVPKQAAAFAAPAIPAPLKTAPVLQNNVTQPVKAKQ